jgi:hypothetical protein
MSQCPFFIHERRIIESKSKPTSRNPRKPHVIHVKKCTHPGGLNRIIDEKALLPIK